MPKKLSHSELLELATESMKRAQDEAAERAARFGMELVLNEVPKPKLKPAAKKPAARKKPAAKAQLAATR